ncbi:hypothetical protein SAMN02745163_04454 [Clostridium cavendishii DSM 21758]|uniref:Uncharacterized protein n=1 Tax=Clostridium cavendishii DSM 21758 TaxID=1121302 RepID=A0A1M6VAE5_9CLOT|nr:hypothetical protein SAMN02745163_04454 [Clostridium cavendishii DSM 21758]
MFRNRFFFVMRLFIEKIKYDGKINIENRNLLKGVLLGTSR